MRPVILDTAALDAAADVRARHGMISRLNGVQKPLAIVEYAEAALPISAPYLVKGLLHRDTISCWHGLPKSGKTFVVLDVCLHIATDRDWRGLRVRHGRVVYLAAEAGRSVLNRLVAARTKFGPAADFAVIVPPVDLLRPDADLPRIIALLEERAPVDMLVIDTLSRTMPGGDENAPQDMTALIGNVDQIRAATGAHCLLVHHQGKDQSRGMRGHSSLLGAVDLSVEVVDRTIRVGPARDIASGASWAFDLEPLEIGRDEDDEPIVSCIVRELDAGMVDAKPERPTGKNQLLALDALNAAIADKGELAPAMRDVPAHVRGVRIDFWRAYFDRYAPDIDGHYRASRFREASTALCASHYVAHVEGFCWVP